MGEKDDAALPECSAKSPDMKTISSPEVERKFWKSKWHALFVALALSYNGGLSWHIVDNAWDHGGCVRGDLVDQCSGREAAGRGNRGAGSGAGLRAGDVIRPLLLRSVDL